MGTGPFLGSEALTPQAMLQLLVKLGAPPRLVRHHELVLEAATLFCDGLKRAFAVSFDRDTVLLGAALHDAGKVLHPDEMHVPGDRHEVAGQQLLLRHGVPAELARFCVTHAAWDAPTATIEDLLVALADKLWKGKRVEELERRVVDAISTSLGTEGWEVFERVDSICEAIAAEGDARLERSLV